MTRVLAFGEVMLEMSDTGDGFYRKSFAGDTFNFAYYLRLAADDGVDVEYLTALGCDSDSDACIEFIRSHGIETTRCSRDPEHSIGLYVLSNDISGEKRYSYWRSTSAARNLFDNKHNFDNIDWLCFSGISVAVSLNRQSLCEQVLGAVNRGCHSAFDFNYRDKLWSAQDARRFADTMLPNTDLAKISDDELLVLYPDMSLKSLSGSYPNLEWVVTHGGEKAEVWVDGKLLDRLVFSPDRKVVDSSAAGDAFFGAYLAAKIAGASYRDCLARGHLFASQVIRKKGAIVEIEDTLLD